MSYSVQNIRNVCLLGHAGNGKTTLVESMLYITGGTVRLGNTADGNTLCDFDPRRSAVRSPSPLPSSRWSTTAAK